MPYYYCGQGSLIAFHNINVVFVLSFSPSWLKQEFSKLPNSIKKLVPLQNKKDLSPMDTNILTVIKLGKQNIKCIHLFHVRC